MSDASETDELEQLRQRKEKLLLEQEVARLERKQALGKVGDWNWWWVAPLALFGIFLFLVGLNENGAAAVVAGLVFLIPAILKFCFRRR